MPVLKTRHQFVAEAIKIHRGKYTYDNFVYAKSHVKGYITCSDHGDYAMTPTNHIGGKRPHGCPECRKAHLSLKFRHDIETVIGGFKKIHGARYDYSKFKYVNSKIKSTVVCSLHGAWQTSANKHLLGRGCPECGKTAKFLRSMLEGPVSLRYTPRWIYGVWFFHKESNRYFYKIGVCDKGGVEKRYVPTSLKADGVEILEYQIAPLNNYEALVTEHYVLSKYVGKKVDTCHILVKCCGGTETLSVNINDLYPDITQLVDEALAVPLQIKTPHIPYDPNSAEYINYRKKG